MTNQPDYSKIYTDSPEQHPNLILGSLQLLFWMFCRPTAFGNHLERIEIIFEIDTSLITFLIEENHILKKLELWKLLVQGFVILPICMTILARTVVILLLMVFGLQLQEAIPLFFVGIVGSVAGGMAVGVVVAMVESVEGGVVGSVIGSMAGGMVGDVEFGVAFGVAFGVTIGVAFGLTNGMELSVLLGSLVGGVVAGEVRDGGVSVVVSVVVSMVFIINFLRPLIFHPLLIIWNFLLYLFEQGRTNKQPSLLPFHPAFWDEWSYIPFQGLDKHLLLVIERNPCEGKAAINYLLTTHQSWAVPVVPIELNVRILEACKTVNDISEITSRLEFSSESPVENILNNFQRISEDTKAARKQSSNYNQRLVLKPICKELEAQIQRLNRSDNKYALRFQSTAIQWRDIISNHIEILVEETEVRQEIDSPYIIGIPLTLQQQIFAGRDYIGIRIEQLLLDRRRPPLLLYGQRRMGKTSLLNNLGKLLPNSIIPMFVDLQGATSSATHYTGFLYNFAKGMIGSAKIQSALNLPPLTRAELKDDPFINFDEWLDKVEKTLEANSEENTALLMLDEFEVLDSAITKGRFDEEDVLGMLRHLIQHRPKFKVLISGSHTIEEYQRWASYLINVQVVNVSYLLEHEARKLIENPIEDFKLRYEPNAVERILQLTRCHPFLVQLMCSELVALKNEQDPSMRRLATLDDVEATIPEALSVGGFFFADIQNNQVDGTGLDILRFIASGGEGGVVSEDSIALSYGDVDYSGAIRLLMQRDLIERVDDGYCFQVELIRRWFAGS